MDLIEKDLHVIWELRHFLNGCSILKNTVHNEKFVNVKPETD